MPLSVFALTPFAIAAHAFICLAISLNFTMCTRTIFVKVFARTALQAAALPGTAFVQPGHLLVYKGQFKWTVKRRVACRVWVSCLQQPGTGKVIKTNKQRTIEGPEDA